MKTFYKLLLYSYDNGPQKKTNMATNCKMSYTRFVPILHQMVLFGFLEIENTPSGRVKITELGKKVLDKMQNDKDINFDL